MLLPTTGTEWLAAMILGFMLVAVLSAVLYAVIVALRLLGIVKDFYPSSSRGDWDEWTR